MRAAEFMRALATMLDQIDQPREQQPQVIVVNNGQAQPTHQQSDARDVAEKDLNPIFVPPLQQDLELKKAAAGKTSPIIKKLTQSEIKVNKD